MSRFSGSERSRSSGNGTGHREWSRSGGYSFLESTTGEVDGGGLLGPVVCGQIQLAMLRGKLGDEGGPT